MLLLNNVTFRSGGRNHSFIILHRCYGYTGRLRNSRLKLFLRHRCRLASTIG